MTAYDRGVARRLADSSGRFYQADPVNERRVQKKETRTRRSQRQLARQVKGSCNSKKTKGKIAKLQNYRARCAQYGRDHAR